MTSDEFDRMVVQGAVKLMLENNRKFLERGGMILAKEFEGELWVKASDLEKKVKQAVEAEREAVLQTIDALYGSEENPMFVEGYDAALDHIKQFIEGRNK